MELERGVALGRGAGVVLFRDHVLPPGGVTRYRARSFRIDPTLRPSSPPVESILRGHLVPSLDLIPGPTLKRLRHDRGPGLGWGRGRGRGFPVCGAIDPRRHGEVGDRRWNVAILGPWGQQPPAEAPRQRGDFDGA